MHVSYKKCGFTFNRTYRHHDFRARFVHKSPTSEIFLAASHVARPVWCFAREVSYRPPAFVALGTDLELVVERKSFAEVGD